jgi:hypothetical protein
MIKAKRANNYLDKIDRINTWVIILKNKLNQIYLEEEPQIKTRELKNLKMQMKFNLYDLRFLWEGQSKSKVSQIDSVQKNLQSLNLNFLMIRMKMTLAKTLQESTLIIQVKILQELNILILT